MELIKITSSRDAPALFALPNYKLHHRLNQNQMRMHHHPHRQHLTAHFLLLPS
ncbi:hypothetical protein OnM2_030081 [Erysiphe neolycopersici]|uniref:Uncharacterized protein n=1 Tax=Erysiphe neolycopersici TaxID=212602 RepID=A0A420HZA1_9PEZI|nr:hypothetical protein OnM2_030081 [Erysiphe neolycopersici]